VVRQMRVKGHSTGTLTIGREDRRDSVTVNRHVLGPDCAPTFSKTNLPTNEKYGVNRESRARVREVLR